MTKIADTTMPALLRGDAGYDPIEDRLADHLLRGFTRDAGNREAMQLAA